MDVLNGVVQDKRVIMLVTDAMQQLIQWMMTMEEVEELKYLL